RTATAPQVFALAQLKAWRVAVDDKRRHAPRASLGIHCREDGVDGCRGSVGSPFLVAVDHIGFTVARGVSLQASSVRTRCLLRETECDELLARRDVRQILFLLFLSAR